MKAATSIDWPERITPAIVAERRGCSVRTARRLLHRLNRQAGGKLLLAVGDGQKAPRVYTTLSRLRRLDPDWETERLAVREDVFAIRNELRQYAKTLKRLQSRINRPDAA